MDMAKVNEKVIEQFRSGGEVDGMHRDRLVLLTTTGRRSGRPHTAPMMALHDGGDLLVVASANGAPRHPSWFLNLEADPHVHVETPDAEFDAVARVLDGAEREHAWSVVTTEAPFFGEHQEQVERRIPVVVLDPA